MKTITRKGLKSLQSEKSAKTDTNLQPGKTITKKSLNSHRAMINTITMWKERWFLSTNVKDIQ